MIIISDFPGEQVILCGEEACYYDVMLHLYVFPGFGAKVTQRTFEGKFWAFVIFQSRVALVVDLKRGEL